MRSLLVVSLTSSLFACSSGTHQASPPQVSPPPAEQAAPVAPPVAAPPAPTAEAVPRLAIGQMRVVQNAQARQTVAYYGRGASRDAAREVCVWPKTLASGDVILPYGDESYEHAGCAQISARNDGATAIMRHVPFSESDPGTERIAPLRRIMPSVPGEIDVEQHQLVNGACGEQETSRAEWGCLYYGVPAEIAALPMKTSFAATPVYAYQRSAPRALTELAPAEGRTPAFDVAILDAPSVHVVGAWSASAARCVARAERRNSFGAQCDFGVWLKTPSGTTPMFQYPRMVVESDGEQNVDVARVGDDTIVQIREPWVTLYAFVLDAQTGAMKQAPVAFQPNQRAIERDISRSDCGTWLANMRPTLAIRGDAFEIVTVNADLDLLAHDARHRNGTLTRSHSPAARNMPPPHIYEIVGTIGTYGSIAIGL